jgi:hypothetical protein
MYNKDNQPWYQAIPYGPLTEDIHSRLASGFGVPGREEMTEVAVARGIVQGEYLALGLKKIRELRAKSALEGVEIEEPFNG